MLEWNSQRKRYWYSVPVSVVWQQQIYWKMPELKLYYLTEMKNWIKHMYWKILQKAKHRNYMLEYYRKK